MNIRTFLALFAAAPTISATVIERGEVSHLAQTIDSTSLTCPITLTSYVTVTVTDTPPTVTVVAPDYDSIISSLASASTVDSIVVVEQSQNAPVSAPKNTAIPTFVHTVVAPAFEATEAPPNNGSAVYYVSVSKNGSSSTSVRPSNVVIGVTTVSVLPQATSNIQIESIATVTSTKPTASTEPTAFSVPATGWNGTAINSTTVNAFGVTAPNRSIQGVKTVTTWVNTTTAIEAVTITPTPTWNGYGFNMSDPPITPESGRHKIQKRQTCVLISAVINGNWASWCNNWDGSTIVGATSFETTVTPGVGDGHISESIISNPSEHSVGISTNTILVTAPPSMSTQSLAVDDITSSPQSTSTVHPTTFVTATSPAITNGCGQLGPFDVTFDDLPKQSATNDTAGLPPIFNPFDHFYWADSWSYLPPPPSPYQPQAGDQLAISSPQSQTVQNDSVTGLIPDGGFGAGPRASLSPYWFNAHWAYVGCQANLTSPSGVCDFVAQGYQYDSSMKENRLHVTQHFSQPLCHSSQCELERIEFHPRFNALTILSFYANVGGYLTPFYVDSMRLGWWNNSCEAGLLRASSRK